MRYLLSGLLLLLLAGCTAPSDGGTNGSTATTNPKFPTVRMGETIIDGATAVYPNSRIVMLFTQAINDTDLNATVKLVRTDTNASMPLSYEWIDADKKLKLTPATVMASNKPYTVILESDFTFADATILGERFTYAFTTGELNDTTEANITIQNITSGDTNVSRHVAWSMRFNEFVDLDTATLNFTAANGITPTLKAGTDGKSAVIMTSGSLNPSDTVTFTLENVMDLAGNEANFTTTFTTQAAFQSVNTYATTYSTGIVHFDYDKSSIVLERHDGTNRTLDILDYAKGTLEANTTDVNISYSGGYVWSGLYDSTLFHIDANKTVLYVSKNGIAQALPYPVSHAYLDKSRACLVSADTNATYLLYIGTSENNYTLDTINPIATLIDQGTPSRCNVLDDQSVLVTTTTGLHAYTPSTDSWSHKVYTGGLDRVKKGNGYIAASSGTSVVLFSEAMDELATLNLGITPKRLRIHGAFLYVLGQNSNTIYVVSLEKLGDATPSLAKVGEFTGTSTIERFGIIDHYLVASYATTATSTTAVELFDIGAYSVTPFVDVKHTLGNIYKLIEGDYNAKYYITAGDSVTYWDANGTILTHYVVPNGPAVNAVQESSAYGPLLVLAKGIHGIEILQGVSVNTIDTNSTVFSVRIFAFVGMDMQPINRLFVGSTDKGLQIFEMSDINDSTPTLLKEDNTNFTAIYDMDFIGYYNSELVMAIADYGQNAIKLIRFDSNFTDYNVTDSFTTLSPPRALYAMQKYPDYNDSYLFAALTAGGQIMRFDIDGDSLGTVNTLSTAGYAMNVHAGVERYSDGSFGYVGLASHLTGTTIFRFSESDPQMKIDGVINNIKNDEYGSVFLKDLAYVFYNDYNVSYETINGAMSFSKNGSLRIYGHQETPKPSYYDNNYTYVEVNTTTDPVLSTIFETVETNVTNTYSIDPF